MSIHPDGARCFDMHPGWSVRAALVCPLEGCGWELPVSWYTNVYTAPHEMSMDERERAVDRHLREHVHPDPLTPQLR